MLTLTLSGPFTGPQEVKQALVADLASLPGVSHAWAFKTVDDLEYWSLDQCAGWKLIERACARRKRR